MTENVRHLIQGIERLVRPEDRDELDRRVTDFAEPASLYEVELARQKTRQRLRPEFHADQLDPADDRRNEALRRAIEQLEDVLVRKRHAGRHHVDDPPAYGK